MQCVRGCPRHPIHRYERRHGTAAHRGGKGQGPPEHGRATTLYVALVAVSALLSAGEGRVGVVRQIVRTAQQLWICHLKLIAAECGFTFMQHISWVYKQGMQPCPILITQEARH